ncbi:hypothetical protein VN97_g8460, partial [Penicillium thymicola]
HRPKYLRPVLQHEPPPNTQEIPRYPSVSLRPNPITI